MAWTCQHHIIIKLNGNILKHVHAHAIFSAAIHQCLQILIGPVLLTRGMDPVQFGIMVIFGLMIGLLTPPMAICLFITSKIGILRSDPPVPANPYRPSTPYPAAAEY